MDLAGSERLNGAEEVRVKETRAIDKSLSALGDVITALAERGASSGGDHRHIPYQNSKVCFRASVFGIEC